MSLQHSEYRVVEAFDDGHGMEGCVTARTVDGKDRHSFSIARRVKSRKNPGTFEKTYWFGLKHLPAIRHMLDRIELWLLKREENAS